MRLYQYRFRAMSCENEIQFFSSGSLRAQQVAESVIAEIRRIEQRFSRYRDDSVTSTINRAAGCREIRVDTETATLLDYAATCNSQSGGLFDITSGVLRHAWNFSAGKAPKQESILPLLGLMGWNKVIWDRPRLFLPLSGMELDFGGIGKEYAADRTADLCLELGIRHGLVNLGGDLCAFGPQPDGKPWLVGIRHPAHPDLLLARIPLYSGALATSCYYAHRNEFNGRYHGHILDPRTGWPAEGMQSVTVHAPNCLTAGSVSTIAMLKGAQGGLDWLQKAALPYLAVTKQDEEHNTFGTFQ
ncbi:MAG: FAD:protein FMN transferase [Sulfurimicrobium sp.]|nr:FAD:protein FMN transferase [Sulfurimicrobium sp.]